MNVIFIHQNFPAQFKHLAKNWSADPRNHVIAICQNYAPVIRDPEYSRVIKKVYKPARKATPNIHHYVHSMETAVLNGQAVARVLGEIKNAGFIPDLVIGHSGWGETLYVKDVYPDVPLVVYCEFYYRANGLDADFDPEFPINEDDILRIRTKNAVNLLSLDSCDIGVSPTAWQKEIYPKEYQSKIQIIHDGIDTKEIAPNANATFQLPNGQVLDRKEEVISYAARGLEPYRGFHTFMRAAEKICKKRPNCHILIEGDDQVYYGRALPNNKSYRDEITSSLKIDHNRVHFLGKLPYEDHIKLLQVSSAHIYLTVPFVLSWSVMEAMAAQCLLVGSDTSPVREIIEHDKNGLLVDFFSPGKIADAVNRVLDHPKRLGQIAKRARQDIVKRYNVTLTLKQYTILHDQLCSSSTSSKAA
jgi:glycosyltransferase involved in cell wall biosynthesis